MPLLNFAKDTGVASGEVSRGSSWDLTVEEDGLRGTAQRVSSQLLARIGTVDHKAYGIVATVAHELATEDPALANPHLFVADAVGRVAVMVQETYGGAK